MLIVLFWLMPVCGMFSFLNVDVIMKDKELQKFDSFGKWNYKIVINPKKILSMGKVWQNLKTDYFGDLRNRVGVRFRSLAKLWYSDRKNKMGHSKSTNTNLKCNATFTLYSSWKILFGYFLGLDLLIFFVNYFCLLNKT